jgi:histidine ammonia-lyase
VITLTEQVVAAMLIAARPAVELRARAGGSAVFGEQAAAMYADLRDRIALVVEDRALDNELRALCEDVRARRWGLYADA